MAKFFNHLNIQTSKHCTEEQRYIIDWVFDELFGLNIQHVPASEDGPIRISAPESPAEILLPDTFFCQADQNWLHADSLPLRHRHEVLLPDFARGDLLNETITTFIAPHDSTAEPASVSINNQCCVIPFDLLGSLFFLVSRYEEAICKELDRHERFPASASLTGNDELLGRAIGNEYIEVLWNCMAQLWPNLKRKPRQFRLLPSHDIDHPAYFWNQTSSSVFKKSMGDFVRRKNFSQGIQRLTNWRRLSKGKPHQDPFDHCDWLMDQSEEHDLQSAFYYIPIKTHAYDPGMPIDTPQVIDQWKRIYQRGHELGYHPGYATFDSAEAIRSGADAIRSQLKALDLDCELQGGRQHVLRWATPTTACHLESAGMAYDSTLGYAERAGFRCGVCYEYPMYDLVSRRPLKLRQRPLVAMDVSITSPRYMNLSGAAAFDLMAKLKQECRKFAGDFTLLWHNTELLTAHNRDLYSSILKA